MSAVVKFERPKIVYIAGFSGLVSVPDDTILLRVIAQAAGGSGREGVGLDYGTAGGGGAFVIMDLTIAPTDWGTSITAAVGNGVSGSDGGNTTVSGTLNGAAFNIAANGGQAGNGFISDGLGGTASGGDTNINGYDGFGFSPGDDIGGTGGNGGGFDQELCEDPIGGLGGNGTLPGEGEQAGYPGYLVLEWY